LTKYAFTSDIDEISIPNTALLYGKYPAMNIHLRKKGCFFQEIADKGDEMLKANFHLRYMYLSRLVSAGLKGCHKSVI
jgi:hypothetical protein